MPKKLVLIAIAISISSALHPQSLASYLPPKSAVKAAKLLAAIDEASSAIQARRGAAREVQSAAEAEAVDFYALLASSRSSGSDWANPEGTRLSTKAAASYAAARSAAKAAAKTCAAGSEEIAAISTSLDAAADALAALILSSGIGAKPALALEKHLAARARDFGRLFPEASELVDQLLKAGAVGARQAAAALAHREAESIAAALVASRARILELSAVSANAADRLEAALGAYRTWIAASPSAAYPGDLGSASAEDRTALATGIIALSSLGQDRAAALLSAMSAKGGRDADAAEAAMLLAQAWTSSPAARRRDLASLCSLDESTLAAFALTVADFVPRTMAATVGRAPIDGRAAITALNAFEIAIADEESSVEDTRSPSGMRGAEPSLVFLELPELAAAASREARYANLHAEASRRIGALYAQAAEGAQARLESSAAVFQASARALGSSPTGLVVRATDLGPLLDGSGRRLAFFVTAADASGASVSLPVRAELAGREYAAAFARAANLPETRVDPAALMAKYGQTVISAYDPEGSTVTFAFDAYPLGVIQARLGPRSGPLALELAALGGWRP